MFHNDIPSDNGMTNLEPSFPRTQLLNERNGKKQDGKLANDARLRIDNLYSINTENYYKLSNLSETQSYQFTHTFSSLAQFLSHFGELFSQPSAKLWVLGKKEIAGAKQRKYS